MERYEQPENSGQNPAAGSIQGEGDYRSAREYREEVKEYLEHADVERAARAAAPRTAREARELEEAEEIGRSRAQHLPRRSYVRSSVERVPGALSSMGRVVQERPLLAIALAGALGCLLAWIARPRREAQ